LLRCASGLAHQNNISLGGWYFNGIELPEEILDVCDAVYQMHSKMYPGVVDLYPCGSLLPDEEGVYTCIMKNSSMMVETTRVGLYLNGRSE